MSLKDWMKDYKTVPLGKIHMPGSHDAGTAKGHINKTLFGTNSNAATQTRTILDQLRIGIRFFDVRLKKVGVFKKKVVAHHTTFGQGATGKQSFDDIIGAAADWLGRHKNEVIIFRISHTDPNTKVHEIIKSQGKGALHLGTGNLCTKTLQQITSAGGGLVCILDHKKFGSHVNQSEGIHSFKKYSDCNANDAGISCCGCYKGTHVLNKVIATGLKGSYEHNVNHNAGAHSHLWQLYWQKTYLNPLSTTGIESGTTKGYHFNRKKGKVHGGTHAATEHMIKLMQGHGRHKSARNTVVEDYEVQAAVEANAKKGIQAQPQVLFSTLPSRNFMLPNIISYDFANKDTNSQIIALNQKSAISVNDDQ